MQQSTSTNCVLFFVVLDYIIFASMCSENGCVSNWNNVIFLFWRHGLKSQNVQLIGVSYL